MTAPRCDWLPSSRSFQNPSSSCSLQQQLSRTEGGSVKTQGRDDSTGGENDNYYFICIIIKEMHPLIEHFSR